MSQNNTSDQYQTIFDLYIVHNRKQGHRLVSVKKRRLKDIKMVVIEMAETKWAASIVFAPKRDGSLRFVPDYRKVNAVAVRDSYSNPEMDECIDSPCDIKIFSTLNASCGY